MHVLQRKALARHYQVVDLAAVDLRPFREARSRERQHHERRVRAARSERLKFGWPVERFVEHYSTLNAPLHATAEAWVPGYSLSRSAPRIVDTGCARNVGSATKWEYACARLETLPRNTCNDESAALLHSYGYSY